MLLQDNYIKNYYNCVYFNLKLFIINYNLTNTNLLSLFIKMQPLLI